jgi:PAS domain S-box-containing protein
VSGSNEYRHQKENMKTKGDQAQTTNSNPVLSVNMNGCVFYSNEAGSLLLNEWDVKIGEKLPSSIVDLVQGVINRNSPEKMEIKVGNRIYLVVFSPLPEQECVNISGFDISDQRGFEKEIQKSEAREGENIELEDIFDIPAIQSLIDDLYKLTHITIGLIDLKGNVSVIAGRQEICSRLHRVHPETCKQCIESDTKLSLGVAPAELKMYKCKNNMWDIATPLIVEGQHIGNIISGQFFFEDETLDYELFRSQARKYGFNEEEYIEALEKVPRLSREAVNQNISFFMKLANMLSQLSHSNFMLAQSLAERNTILEVLRKSEERFRSAFDDSAVATALVCPDARLLKVNDAFCRMLGYEKFEMESRTFFDFTYPDDIEPSIKTHKAVINRDKSVFWLEKRYIRKDGRVIWCEVSSSPVFDSKGCPIYTVAHIQDITERKLAEEALKEAHENLEEKIKKRTAELEKAYASLKESERSLAEAQEMAHIGSWERNIASNEYSWSDELYRIFGLKPQESKVKYDTVLRYVHPDDRNYVNNAVKETLKGKSLDINFRIIRTKGEERIAHAKAEVVFDEKNNPIRIIGTTQDITERKRIEEALRQSEERFNLAVKAAQEGVWDWNMETDEVWYSSRYKEMLGYSEDEIEQHVSAWLRLLHPDDRERCFQLVDTVMRGERNYELEFRLRHKDGRYLNILSRGYPVRRESDGKIVRIVGIHLDLTERKQAEEEIQNLANIVESSNDAIGTMSFDNIITNWNKASEEVYGYSAEEIIGKHGSILAPPHLKKEICELSEMIKQGKKVRHYETSRLRKDGKIIEVSITLSPVFDSHGKLLAISVIARDITERKEAEEKLRVSEEKYRNIVETSNEGIIIIDDEAKVTYANNKVTDMLGYSLEEGIGRPIWNFADEEGKTILKQNLEKRRQGVNESYELKLICKDGSLLWTLINAKSLIDKDGKFAGSLSMLTDITERKKAEEALNNIETARKKEIHHRIKNNLQVISSLLDLQAEQFRKREDIRDSEVLEAFRESQNRVISMALIHEELYKGGGSETLNFSPYIRELADTLLQTYRLGNTEISLNMDLEEDLFFDIDTAVPLGIIVNELISNSLKHAFPDRKKGEIKIKLLKEEPTELENEGSQSTSTNFTLTISDNGIGIPENFDIKNLDSLGMQLVTSLVDQLDGELELKRKNGTEFTIRFTVTEKNE